MEERFKKLLPNIIKISKIIVLMLGSFFFIKEKYILSLGIYLYGVLSNAFDVYFARINTYAKFG